MMETIIYCFFSFMIGITISNWFKQVVRRVIDTLLPGGE